MGTLGDRIGRRKLLLIGGAAFAVLSVVAAHSVNPQMLIVRRGLLGIAIGVAFIRRQLMLDTPLLDLRLFRNRPFTAR
jgi:DHA2 family multidrug resistance protein-like MFS transporter